MLAIGSRLALGLLARGGLADVITYEGDTFPEDHEDPWERTGTLDADRSLRGGWLIIDVDLGDWEPPPGGEQDFYKRWGPKSPGEPFFVEWRCISDAPNTEIPGTGGSVLNAVGFNVINHFTITEDKVRIWRGNTVPFVFVDIESGVPHTYRVEHYADQLYIYYIDGEIVDSGIPRGGFPNASARIIWGSKMWWTPSTNEWDYVRYGTIPEAGSGDFDSDEDVDLRDFYFFDECVTNGGPGVEAGPGCLWADLDGDGDVDFADMGLFQLAFTGSE
jgi:hypothetical protein